MNLPIGKRVADGLYIHSSAIAAALPPEQLSRVESALEQLPEGHSANVVKLNTRLNLLSWLAYEEFDDAPFPRLLASWTFDLTKCDPPTYRNYRFSLNPPILHRKELLVELNYPGRNEWIELTKSAEDLGFFDDASAIGFERNWLNVIASKGYQLAGGSFSPIGNELSAQCTTELQNSESAIHRHLTALNRTTLSAPIQLLARHGMLQHDKTIFDYGCGRGGDMQALLENGYQCGGWDPHFAYDNPKVPADVVNIGFVINVIEDPVERVDALHQAFRLSKGVLSVAVMLVPSELSGVPFQDGILTTRNTFQKYFTQSEVKGYIEDVLQNEAFMVGPGVAFVFRDKALQQAFEAKRYRSHALSRRLAIERRPRKSERRSKGLRAPLAQRQLLENKELFDALWVQSLELGRFPQIDEIDFLHQIEAAVGSINRALRLVSANFDLTALTAARKIRSDDLVVYLAVQQFRKRPTYRKLESRIQNDIKVFFGDYQSAVSVSVKLLHDCGDPDILFAACAEAASNGFGWLDGSHSLQLHVSLIEKLPAILRVYIACGLVLWDSLSEVQLVKIHIGSGKLSLLEFDNFETSKLPTLRRRIKVNLPKLDYNIFEYGSVEHPKPVLYFKSRFIHEESEGYAEQFAFDSQLSQTGCVGETSFGPTPSELETALELKRLEIFNEQLQPCSKMPELDSKCGEHFTYRSFIDCGETQSKQRLPNLPKNFQSFNALYDLATQILDPVIDYFGGIRLTYGFCSPELSQLIKRRVAHNKDQHASCEINKKGHFICDRLGAACDFIVEDENMLEVAKWIAENLPFDRLYFYGITSPLHVSYGPEHSRVCISMVENSTGVRLPRTLDFSKLPDVSLKNSRQNL